MPSDSAPKIDGTRLWERLMATPPPGGESVLPLLTS
jgi:hypothetical protein